MDGERNSRLLDEQAYQGSAANRFRRRARRGHRHGRKPEKANGMYAQRLNASGALQWRPAASPWPKGWPNMTTPTASPDGSGGLIVSWMDYIAGAVRSLRPEDHRLRNCAVGTDAGDRLAAIDDQRDASIAPDGTGGAIIAWQDSRNGNFDVYAQLIDSKGRPGWLGPDIASVDDVPGDQGGRVYLSWYAARADRSMDEEMSYYSIWRSIDAAQAALAVRAGASRDRISRGVRAVVPSGARLAASSCASWEAGALIRLLGAHRHA